MGNPVPSRRPGRDGRSVESSPVDADANTGVGDAGDCTDALASPSGTGFRSLAEGNAPICVNSCSGGLEHVGPGVMTPGKDGATDGPSFDARDGVDGSVEVVGDGFQGQSCGQPHGSEGVKRDGGFGVLEGVEDLAGDVALQAAADVALGQSFGGAPSHVVHGRWVLV